MTWVPFSDLLWTGCWCYCSAEVVVWVACEIKHADVVIRKFMGTEKLRVEWRSSYNHETKDRKAKAVRVESGSGNARYLKCDET